MKPFPEVVTYKITSKCNNNCSYCYASRWDDLEFSKLKKIFNLFYKRGVKGMLLTGGEPLLREDFEDIIKELKKYNFKIFLDTTGDLFFKYQNLITENVDCLGLPIDFPNKSYRNQDNLNNILKILEFYKGKSTRPQIKIGTVVTQDNINEIEKIGELIKNYPVDTWKIYEFIPVNDALKNRSSLEISLHEFDDVTKRIEKKYSKYFKIVISKRSNRASAYFLVAADKLFMPLDDLIVSKEIEVGNIFDEDIVKKWEKVVSKINYHDNLKATYNL